jgi:hypothetical protein
MVRRLGRDQPRRRESSHQFLDFHFLIYAIRQGQTRVTATFEIDGLSRESWKRLTNGRWTLCIGAGINGKLLPDWLELARQIVNKANGKDLDHSTFSDLVKSSNWTLDAWIQQALNRHLADDKELKEFSEQLRYILYGTVLDLSDQHGLRDEIALALNDTQRITKEKFDDVLKFFEDNFRDTTVYKLADILTDLDPDDLPTAVLNFNADTFLETLLTLLTKKKKIRSTGVWYDPPEVYSRIVRSSDEVGSRIPIYHLHGCLPPRSPAGGLLSETPNGMIFPENSYSRLAGRMFSWAQSIFLYHAQAETLCFIGLSMADANIRRWLAWTFEGYTADLIDVTASKDLSGKHVWLNTKVAGNGVQIDLYTYALRHLGVQVCWLPNWRSFDSVFKQLLGISR